MKQQRNFALAISFFLMLLSFYALTQTKEIQDSEVLQESKEIQDSEVLQESADFYDDVGPLIDGAIVVKKNGKYGLIKNGGEVIVEPKYDYIDTFSGDNGTRFFEENDLWGYLDKNGNVIIEPQFEYASSFYDKKAQVRKGLNVYYIDIHGKILGLAE